MVFDLARDCMSCVCARILTFYLPLYRLSLSLSLPLIYFFLDMAIRVYFDFHIRKERVSYLTRFNQEPIHYKHKRANIEYVNNTVFEKQLQICTIVQFKSKPYMLMHGAYAFIL